MELLQLVYTSTVTEDWDGDLHTLAGKASACNARSEITGILLCRRRQFLQVLEGPQTPVEDTFIRIIRDIRHHSLRILSRRLLTAREFGDWAMAELNTDEDERDAIAMVSRIMADAQVNAQAIFNAKYGDVATVASTSSAQADGTPIFNRFAAQGWRPARPRSDGGQSSQQ